MEPEYSPFLKTFANQEEFTKQRLENKIYELIAELYKYKFSADRFDRIRDFTKTVAIIPISALSGGNSLIT